MDGSSYFNCDVDKRVACSSFVSNCLDEQAMFISFLVKAVEGDLSWQKVNSINV